MLPLTVDLASPYRNHVSGSSLYVPHTEQHVSMSGSILAQGKGGKTNLTESWE